MKAVWKTIRWLLAVLVLGGSLKLFLDTVGHVPGPASLGLPFWFWYGNWRAFLNVTATSILFLLAFTLAVAPPPSHPLFLPSCFYFARCSYLRRRLRWETVHGLR